MCRRRAWTARLIVLVAAVVCPWTPALAFSLSEPPPTQRAVVNLNLLPAAPFATLGYGFRSFNDLAEMALGAWNQVGIGVVADHQFFSVQRPAVTGDACRRDGVSEVRFSSTICGMQWGDTLAVTISRSVAGAVVETDILFDAAVAWDAFPGPATTDGRGRRLRDFLRVATHELGHAAGLDHPDEAGQMVVAIMNSTITDVDAIQPDDAAGAGSVFWGPPCAAAPAATPGAALEGFVADLYRVVLGREPAASEVAAWSGYLAARPHLAAVATVTRAFFTAPEFRAAPITPWVEAWRLYQAVLGRAPDPFGFEGVVAVLLDRASTLVPPFVSSQEYGALVPFPLTRGAVEEAVRRLYEEALGRVPAAEEIGAWADYLMATRDLAGASARFLTSTEYLIVPRTAAGHVTVLYRALLGRDPAPGEAAFWQNELVGQLGSVSDAFVASPEFQGLCPDLFR